MSNHFIKNTQTTNALTFLTHNISAIGGVKGQFEITYLWQELLLVTVVLTLGLHNFMKKRHTI